MIAGTTNTNIPKNCPDAASLYDQEVQLRRRSRDAALSHSIAIGAAIAAIEMRKALNRHQGHCGLCRAAEIAANLAQSIAPVSRMVSEVRL